MIDRDEFDREEYKAVISFLEKRRALHSTLEPVLKIYSLLGLLIAAMAIGYFALTLLPVELSYNQQMALIISGVGIVVAALSQMLLVLRKQREERYQKYLEEYERFGEFMQIWSMIEASIKSSLGAESSQHKSLRIAIHQLYKNGVIDKSDLMSLEESLRLRNSIVHEGGGVSIQSLGRLSEDLRSILHKISHQG